MTTPSGVFGGADSGPVTRVRPLEESEGWSSGVFSCRIRRGGAGRRRASVTVCVRDFSPYTGLSFRPNGWLIRPVTHQPPPPRNAREQIDERGVSACLGGRDGPARAPPPAGHPATSVVWRPNGRRIRPHAAHPPTPLEARENVDKVSMSVFVVSWGRCRFVPGVAYCSVGHVGERS